MQPDEAFGMGEPFGNPARIEIGGVGRQHRIRPADTVEFGEDGALDGDLLEHRLDHQIAS